MEPKADPVVDAAVSEMMGRVIPQVKQVLAVEEEESAVTDMVNNVFARVREDYEIRHAVSKMVSNVFTQVVAEETAATMVRRVLMQVSNEIGEADAAAADAAAADAPKESAVPVAAEQGAKDAPAKQAASPLQKRSSSILEQISDFMGTVGSLFGGSKDKASQKPAIPEEAQEAQVAGMSAEAAAVKIQSLARGKSGRVEYNEVRDEEACRQWVAYYVATRQFAKAEELGWDGKSPAPPADPAVATGSDEQHANAAIDSMVGRVFTHVREEAGEEDAKVDGVQRQVSEMLSNVFDKVRTKLDDSVEADVVAEVDSVTSQIITSVFGKVRSALGDAGEANGTEAASTSYKV